MHIIIFGRELSLLGWALVFLILALIAGVFGFEIIAGFSFFIARLLAMIFFILLILALIFHFFHIT